MLILISTNPAKAIIRNVPSDYLTIQDAINAALNGDVVVIADGTYTGVGNRDIDFKGKAITVRSQNGPANCTIDCQGNGRGFKFHSGEGSDSAVIGLTITNGYAPVTTYQHKHGQMVSYSAGGAIFCDRTAPTIENCIIDNNNAQKLGGGIYCNVCTGQIITGCVFTGNSTSDDGGGLETHYCSITVERCSFIGNSAPFGGGMLSKSGSSIIRNCLFWDNKASGGGALTTEQGGGIEFASSLDEVVNCTFIGNSAPGYWGGGAIIAIDNSCSITLTNSIFWGNTATRGPQITLQGGASMKLSHCEVQGGEVDIFVDSGCTLDWDDATNINTDPMFVDAGSGDCHLLAGSPCIDAGDNSAVAGVPTDLDGNPRIVNSIVDMGAYEAPSTNKSPIADAGPDQTASACGLAMLDGSASSDPDSDPLTYTWSFVSVPTGSQAEIAHPTAVQTTFVADLSGEYVVSLIVNDGTIDSEPDTVTITALSPEQNIQQIIEVLYNIVDSNPGTPLADKIEDVIEKLLTVLDELNKPDNQAAVGNIEGAVGDLEAAVKDELLSSEQGIQLMDDLACIARRLAKNALEQVIAQGGDPDAIDDAELSLLEGDQFRTVGAFKDAVNKYKDALAKAESEL
jgi:hypothetical protein